MSGSSWYYAIGMQQHGPVAADVLRDLVARGQIRPDDLVWREGMTTWRALRDVTELAAGLPVAAVVATGIPPAYPGQLDYYTPAFELGVAYAGFWWRFLAALLDGVILYMGNLFFSLLNLMATGAPIFGQSARPTGAQIAGTFAAGLATMVLHWLYYAGFESSPSQATPGKRICGLRVSDLHGQRISFGRASGRWFASALSILTIYIGFMMAGWTQRKQALHDLVADTLVVRP